MCVKSSDIISKPFSALHVSSSLSRGKAVDWPHTKGQVSKKGRSPHPNSDREVGSIRPTTWISVFHHLTERTEAAPWHPQRCSQISLTHEAIKENWWCVYIGSEKPQSTYRRLAINLEPTVYFLQFNDWNIVMWFIHRIVSLQHSSTFHKPPPLMWGQAAVNQWERRRLMASPGTV